MKLFLTGLMLLMHVIADFNLQGWLATSKQKKWWHDNYPGKMYANDWKACILAHGFMWSMMVMLPLFWYVLFYVDGVTEAQREYFSTTLFVVMLINSIIHAFIDHFKCNKMSTNLIMDQSLHIIQILVTWYICAAFIPVL